MNAIVRRSPDNGAARCQGEMAPAFGLACIIAADWRAFLNLASPQPEEGARCRLHSPAASDHETVEIQLLPTQFTAAVFPPFFHFNEG